MIPKIIHYCWFGPNPKSDIAKKCLESWKAYCPDYEFKEWTEATISTFENKFVKDALRKKKYAFASDRVRVQALYYYGGVYMDLDMLLLKPIDALLHFDFFTGYEVKDRAAYGIFGAIPQHRLIKKMVQFYEENYFNQFSLPVITHTFKSIVHESGLLSNERIFEPNVFYALKYEDREKQYQDFVTRTSYAVHLWDHSWASSKTESWSMLVSNLRIVLSDYLFHAYPYAYFKRYFKEYSRKLYHKLIGTKSV